MEEVLFDTSALINLLRSGKQTARGFTTIFNIIEFPKALELKELGIIYPVVEDYSEATRISTSLLKIGKPIPAIDVLVATMSFRRDLMLFTADEHFLRVKSTRKRLKLKIIK